MITKVSKHVMVKENKTTHKSGYVALLGAPNAGKSTLMNHLLKEKISITAPRPQTTRNRILGILTKPDFQVVFVDTPGIHAARDRFNKTLVETALAALSEVDVICFLIEAQTAARDVNQMIIEELCKVDTPAILAINKIDLVRNKQELLPIIDKYKEYMEFRAVVPISALLGDGVNGLLTEIIELLPEGPNYYPEDYLTDQPERFLAAELVREKIFRLTHQEVPYAVAVTVEKFSEDEQRSRIEIEATVHVERDSQKAIIIGKQGLMLKEIGKQARKDIEALLGCHVYLGLFVKVQKNWRKNPRALAEFGYRNN